MAGHRKFSELTKDFSAERKRRIAANTADALARLDREVHIEPIVLEWSDWHSWQYVERDARQDGVAVPNRQPGVYEARLNNCEDRLTIGKASDLRRRVKQGLVRGKMGHPSGDKIRAIENLDDVVVRWAVTERPAAVEEELHMRHKDKFGALPKYTQHT